VIDAALDPAIYQALAEARGWRIRRVVDTHIHADHLSRSRLLAAATGALLYLPAQERARYPFTAPRDGDTLAVGAARLSILRTPGHTAESSCLLLEDRVLFTGDTLFPMAVGRPDLEATAEEAAARSAALYRSLTRILALPPTTLVLAGHTTPPVAFDRQPIGASLAMIRPHVPGLEQPVGAFVADLLGRLPPPPPNHQRLVACNEAGEFAEPEDTALEAGGNRCAVG
jgi:glyoxylase-like metal-dependent hydrolase (beta-lactamase superfamily II)